MYKIGKALIPVILIVFIGCAIMEITGCADGNKTGLNDNQTQVSTEVKVPVKAEGQLTKQDIRDIVADVVKQSSQNGLFNFNLDGDAMLQLASIVFGSGLAASFTRKAVTCGANKLRKRKSDPIGKQ
jgi:uncharacterized protein YpuA (DUF1002 family)